MVNLHWHTKMLVMSKFNTCSLTKLWTRRLCIWAPALLKTISSTHTQTLSTDAIHKLKYAFIFNEQIFLLSYGSLAMFWGYVWVRMCKFCVHRNLNTEYLGHLNCKDYQQATAMGMVYWKFFHKNKPIFLLFLLYRHNFSYSKPREGER